MPGFLGTFLKLGFWKLGRTFSVAGIEWEACLVTQAVGTLSLQLLDPRESYSAVPLWRPLLKSLNLVLEDKGKTVKKTKSHCHRPGKVEGDWHEKQQWTVGTGVTATYFWISERPEIVKRGYFPYYILLVKNI